jgi:hypothetical protein
MPAHQPLPESWKTPYGRTLKYLTWLCLQEVVQGKSLGQIVSSGQRASEEEVQRIATDLLSTLKYLSGKCWAGATCLVGTP